MLSFKHSFIFLILVLSLLLQFCKPKERVVPDLPPRESLNADLSFFDQTAPVGSNYEFAQMSVQNWTDFINDSLDFHRHFYEEVLERTLEYQTKNTWLITFDAEFNEINYTVNFFEKEIGDSITLKLFLSYDKLNPQTDEDSLSEVLIMDGYMKNYEFGEWTINLIDTGFSNTLNFLTVEWELKTDQNPDISFKNLLEVENMKNNRLHYKDSINEGYMYYIDIKHEADDNHTYIQWNSSSNIGRVSDNFHFGNVNWYCWDEILSDQVCPTKSVR